MANILWTKAIHDYNAAHELCDVDPETVGDQVFGLLLQQCVEKALKASILRCSLKYQRVHDIAILMKTLAKRCDVKPEFGELCGLSSYAATERYESPFSTHRLDREGLLDLTRVLLEKLEHECP